MFGKLVMPPAGTSASIKLGILDSLSAFTIVINTNDNGYHNVSKRMILC